MSSKSAVRMLLAATGIVLVSFVAENSFMLWTDHQVWRQARSLQSTVGATVEHISNARTQLVDLAACDSAPARPPRAVIACARDVRRRLDEELDGFAALPESRKLTQPIADTREALTAFDARIAALERVEDGPHLVVDGALAALIPSMRPIEVRLDQLAHANSTNLTRVASGMLSRRKSSQVVELVLDSAAVLLAIIATLLGVHAIRRHTRFLEEKAAELEKFASTVAHDVLSPLASLGVAMPVIQRRHPHDEQTQLLVNRALSSVRNVRAIVDGLLEFARVGAHSAGGRADVPAIILDAVRELREQVAESRAELSVGLEQPGVAACSPGVLLSILLNLLRNALKYLGESTERRVAVRAKAQRGVVAFEVEDSGPGIPPALRDSIFDPYVRLPASGQPGLGLGLATVRRLVQAHGGRVGVRPAEKRGSIFWFELPCVVEEASRLQR